MHFLCDATDLKHSVECTLKVKGKSLTTILDEVRFIVNLYSFSLPMVSQANPFFPKLSHFPPPRQGVSVSLGSFKVGSVPGMINEDMLARFICKPA